MNPELASLLDQARESGALLASSHDNIREMLAAASDPVCEASVTELAEAGEWEELNDRFFQTLAFGTGGLRGRTISDRPTAAERGAAGPGQPPEHPCVGTNALNAYNMTRATLGLVRHLKAAHAAEGRPGRPSLAVARDTRHFGAGFADLAARVAAENGCDVHRFSHPRSTPELSFAVRHLGAGAGVVLTASHNPPQDNGFKAYWNDGAQVVEPHASAIIAEVTAAVGDRYDAVPESERGAIADLGPELDAAYMDRLETLLLDPEVVREQRDSLRIVFSNLHGTGGAIAPAMLRRLGFRCDTVAEQDTEDGWFPTVKSPNPENAEALALALAQAERDEADLVIATDPDGDRMGVAVRDASGAMVLLTGNQIGSLLAAYRIDAMLRQGILDDSSRASAVLVKTFVTTELQAAIAESRGVGCVNTLTGFKYIGEKLGKYESQIPAALRQDYRSLPDAETRALRLAHSRFFVFGGEESYGYLGSDFLRDKDANGAVVMFAELAAHAKSRGITLPGMLDELYRAHGYHREGQHSEKLEGADGAARIQALARDYSERPPAEMDGAAVARARDFAREDIRDEEGDLLPKEKMLFIDLADGRAFAVRPSGTEPKIKFYFYLRPAPGAALPLDEEGLARAKEAGDAAYESLVAAVVEDMRQRLARLPA